MGTKQIKLDKIQLNSRVRVSDPCYGTGVWCSGEIANVFAGQYIPTVNMSNEGMWGYRVTSIQVVHSDFEDKDLSFNERVKFEVGVDSGMAGIYDADYYEQYHSEKEHNSEWYSRVCVEVDPYCTKDNKCVISSSGFGDGSYNCYVAKNSVGQVVGILIEFITDDDFDEEVEEDETMELPWHYGGHFE